MSSTTCQTKVCTNCGCAAPVVDFYPGKYTCANCLTEQQRSAYNSNATVASYYKSRNLVRRSKLQEKTLIQAENNGQWSTGEELFLEYNYRNLTTEQIAPVNFYGYSMMEQVDGLTVNGDVTDYQIKFHPVSNKQIFDDPRQGSGAETLNVLVVGNPDIAPQITQPLRRMATKKSKGLPNYDLILGAWGTDRAETVQITDLAGVVWKKASPINPK